MKTILISLQGNIAAGKTTLLDALATTRQFGIIREPVELWQNSFPDNLLELFYRDPSRWAFTFQIGAFITRAKTLREIIARTNHTCNIQERSIACDKQVFAELTHRLGTMTDTEYELYSGLWNFLTENYCIKPNLIIYLRTPATICHKRIQQRGRPEEANISLNYLLNLEQAHDEWLHYQPNVTWLRGEESAPLLASKALATIQGEMEQQNSASQC